MLMIVDHPRPITASIALLTAATFLSCSSTGPSAYWSRFQPTQGNFREYFEEHGRELDQIEGVWQWERIPTIWEETAIIRDSSIPDYEFVALQLPPTAVAHGSERRRDYRYIMMAFRRTESDTLYEFLYIDELGRRLPNETLEGTIVVKFNHLWFPGANRDPTRRDEKTWLKAYP
jgi:hypothetical protein